MSTDNTDRPAPQTPGTPDDVDSASASAATPVTGPVAANAPQGETSVNLTGETPTSVKSPASKVAQGVSRFAGPRFYRGFSRPLHFHSNQMMPFSDSGSQRCRNFI
mgnify:CR=1 FL=1